MTTHRIAYNVLDSVLRGGAYLNLALRAGLKDTDSLTASSVTAIVYTAVENVKYSDYLISHYTKGRLHGSIRLILRMGIAEILFMNTACYAVCDECVKLTKDIGKKELTGFVNAVLRRVIRERDELPELPKDDSEYLQIKYGLPDFLADEYIREYGRSFTEEMLSGKFSLTCVRAQYPHTVDELTDKLIPNDPVMKELPYRHGKLVSDALILEKGGDIASSDLFKKGSMAVQSESAMLVCRICKPVRGMRVLDACAAPGGKSAYLASLMQNDGEITAWELHENRAELTRKTISRLHADIVKCEQHDSTVLDESLIDNMDLVLADVPCSGFGVGSKPDTYLNRTNEDIEEIRKIQQDILHACSKYVRPGGGLVYSTCTISKRENEDNAAWFLKTHPDFIPDEFSSLLPEEYSERSKNGMLQLFPHLDGTDGFFIARFIRKQSQKSGCIEEIPDGK